MFATGDPTVASIGRFLQGAGGVFALVGAIFIVTKNFPASMAATLIGATQMFGMAGGSAGQFAVGPMISGGLKWSSFWIGMGVLGLVIGVLLFLLIPKQENKEHSGSWLGESLNSFKVVFMNPQSIICGLISGFLFIPTTILGMTWGVSFLQEGHGLDYGSAVMRSATVPLGWMIGCPLLGFISDKLGRRKPVIVGGGLILLGCLAWILYGPAGVLPPYVLGVVAGIASGAAMLPYTVIKEVNPPEFGGTATGVVNFLNFTFSALLGPVFAGILQGSALGEKTSLADYQFAFTPMLFGVGVAILLALILRETGPAVRGEAANGV